MYVAIFRGHFCDSGPWQEAESLGKGRVVLQFLLHACSVCVWGGGLFRAGFKGMGEMAPKHKPRQEDEQQQHSLASKRGHLPMATGTEVEPWQKKVWGSGRHLC